MEIKLEQNAKNVLNDNFTGNLGWTYVNQSTQIQYDTESSDFPIKSIQFKCYPEDQASKLKLFDLGCFDSGKDIQKKITQNLKVLCEHPFEGKQSRNLYYVTDIRAYWETDKSDKVMVFGYVDHISNAWTKCLDAKQLEATTKKGDPEDSWDIVFSSDNMSVQLDSKNIVRKGAELRFWTYYKYPNRRCLSFCDSMTHSPEIVDSAKFFIGINCFEEQFRILGYQYFQLKYNYRVPYISNNAVGDWLSIIDYEDKLLKDKVCNL